MFNAVRENLHDETQSERPSLVNDVLERKVNERVRDDRLFTIPDLSMHFPQISRTLLYDTVSNNLDYQRRRRAHSMRGINKNLCPAKINASIMAENV
jgi:hypothetical protein